MTKIRIGDKVRIAEGADQILGKTGKVGKIGGFGYENDDVLVNLDNGQMIMVKKHQLEKIEENNKVI